jgi:hypothetical protein
LIAELRANGRSRDLLNLLEAGGRDAGLLAAILDALEPVNGALTVQPGKPGASCCRAQRRADGARQVLGKSRPQ